MTDRREFLKLFGVGCAIVPIIGGAPVIAAESTLIEVPKLIPVEKSTWAGKFEGPFGDRIFGGPMGMTVTLDNPINAQRITLQGKTFILSMGQELGDIRSKYNKQVRAQYIKERTATWKFEGQFIPNENNDIATLTQEFIR